MSERLLDRHNYSRETLNTFELISAYYIDIYYNHLYFHAQNLKTEGKVLSITMGYKYTLDAFLTSMNSPDFHKKHTIDLKELFAEYDNPMSSMTYNVYLDKIAREFVPMDYCNVLNYNQKTHVIQNVLTQANKKFIFKIMQEYLIMIIDDHNEPDNIRVMQEAFIDVLLMEREVFYERFISQKTRTNVKTPHIDSSLLEKMKTEMKLLINEKYELKDKLQGAKHLILTKNEEIIALKREIMNLNNNITELKSHAYQPQNNREIIEEVFVSEDFLNEKIAPTVTSTDIVPLEKAEIEINDHITSVFINDSSENFW